MIPNKLSNNQTKQMKREREDETLAQRDDLGQKENKIWKISTGSQEENKTMIPPSTPESHEQCHLLVAVGVFGEDCSDRGSVVDSIEIEQQQHINHVPSDCLIHIFEYCTAQILSYTVPLVCNVWYNVVTLLHVESLLWKQICLREWPIMYACTTIGDDDYDYYQYGGRDGDEKDERSSSAGDNFLRRGGLNS